MCQVAVWLRLLALVTELIVQCPVLINVNRLDPNCSDQFYSGREKHLQEAFVYFCSK